MIDFMRLRKELQKDIKQIIHSTFGHHVSTVLFGSRVDDEKQGGDVDLLIETHEVVENPAMVAAMVASKISRLMFGRKVDVILKAPNLKNLPIHDIARETGIKL